MKKEYDYDFALRGLLFIILEYVKNQNADEIEACYVIKKLEQIINQKEMDFEPAIAVAVHKSRE